MKKCFKKIVLKINTAKTSDNIAFFLCMTVLLSIMMTFIVVLNYRGVSYQVFQSPANISATFYNVLSPFIAIVAAALTFMAFWTQYKANQKMLKNNAKQEVERQFYEMLRIHKENVKELKWRQWTISESSNPNFIRSNESLLKGKFYHNDKYAYKEIVGRQAFLYHVAEYILIEKCLIKAIEMVKANENLNIDLNKYEHYKEVVAFAYTIYYEGMDEIRSYFTDEAEIFFSMCDFALDSIDKSYKEKKRLFLKKYPLKKEYLFDDKNGRIYLYFYFFLCRYKKKLNLSSSRTNVERKYCGFDFYNGHAYELNHYYRHLYQMVKIVANYDNLVIEKEEKKKYLKMLRAQLTGNEQLMLFYNWLAGYGCDWENEENHFFTDYRMIHNINIEDSGIFRKVGYEVIVKKLKMGNLDCEYKDGCLFEFEERKLLNAMHVYDRILNEKNVFMYGDLLPYEIKKNIGNHRYDKAAGYLRGKYGDYIYYNTVIAKDDYVKAVTDIQNYIKQMFVRED